MIKYIRRSLKELIIFTSIKSATILSLMLVISSILIHGIGRTIVLFLIIFAYIGYILLTERAHRNVLYQRPINKLVTTEMIYVVSNNKIDHSRGFQLSGSEVNTAWRNSTMPVDGRLEINCDTSLFETSFNHPAHNFELFVHEQQVYFKKLIDSERSAK